MIRVGQQNKAKKSLHQEWPLCFLFDKLDSKPEIKAALLGQFFSSLTKKRKERA